MPTERGDFSQILYRLETIEVLQANLATANEFSEAELASNRAGRIADTQYPRLLGMALQAFVRSGAVLCGWLLFLLVVYSFVPGGLLAYSAMRIPGFAMGAVAITITAFVAFFGGFFKTAAALYRLCHDLVCHDLATGKVLCLEGRTWTSTASEKGKGMDALHDERVDHHYYVVQNQYLPVTLLGYRALRDYSGSVCKVYIAPRSKLLLSLEPMNMKRA